MTFNEFCKDINLCATQVLIFSVVKILLYYISIMPNSVNLFVSKIVLDGNFIWTTGAQTKTDLSLKTQKVQYCSLYFNLFLAGTTKMKASLV